MKNKVLFIVTAIVVFLFAILASSIVNRKNEAKYKYVPQVEIADNEPRNDEWGKNFPKEYQSYLQTSESEFASYQGGSAMRDMLEEDPLLVVLWAGYGFSKDYNQGRGHYYAVEDLHNSLRTGAPKGEGDGPMPSTCWTCKSPDVPRLMNEKGIAEFYKGKWADKGHEVVNAIGCADCHDSKTMKLTITRPALVEAFESMGKDINKATHQEMRSLVCAQCHSEYYFNKNLPGKEGVPYLVFPWKNGLSAENMEAYYDEIDFTDWTHKISKAPMLKAQHPGYESYLTGVHADRGVSCADCHMPYKSEGGQKFTDHHVQSPLNNINNACQVCHRESEDKLIKNVFERQQKSAEIRVQLEELLVRSHIEAGKAWELGATEEQMKDYEKAFDSVKTSAILQALRNQGVEELYVKLFKDIYTECTATLQLHRNSEKIPIRKGVRQGDTISPKLFTACLEEIFKKLNWENFGIRVNVEYLTNLRFADDIVLLSEKGEEL